MDVQGQRFIDTRGFRIAVFAFAAVAVLALAAYFFGTGLRADTSASVAPSPLGSSLTNVRESRSEDYFARWIESSAAAKAASLAGSRLDDYYFRMKASSASRLEDRYDRMNTSSAAISSASAGLSAADYAAKSGIPAAAVIRPESLETLAARWANFYAGLDQAMVAAGARPSAGSPSTIASSSAANQLPWIKPESVKPSEATGLAAKQYQWIKPEGIMAR